MGMNVAGMGEDGAVRMKKRAGTGGDGVSVDLAGRGWGHIFVPVQHSSADAMGSAI